MDWYFNDTRGQIGPVSLQQLKQTLATLPHPEDVLVWCENFSDWRRAGDVPELMEQTALPPLLHNAYPATKTQRGHATRPPRGVDALEVHAEKRYEVQTEQKVAARNSRNYFARHWRGELSLPVSYWVNGAILNAVATFAIAMLAADLNDRQEVWTPFAAVSFLGLVSLFTLSLATWQTVGIVRSARRRGGVWGGFALVAVVLAAINTSKLLVANTGPVFLEFAKILIYGDPFPTYTLQILKSGTELALSGGIRTGIANDFSKLLAAAPEVRIVHLNSLGGRIGEARAVGQQIRRRGLITYVSDQCASACTIVFLHGQQKWIAETGRLGFHQYYLPGLGTEEAHHQILEEKQELLALGMPSAMVEKASTTPHDSMWMPTDDELLGAGMITGVADSSYFELLGKLAQIEDDATPLVSDGKARRGFVDAVRDSCVKNQGGSAGNKAFSNTSFTNYCICFASALADVVTYKEIKSAQGDIQDSMLTKIQLVGQTCAKTTLDEVLLSYRLSPKQHEVQNPASHRGQCPFLS